MADSIRMASRAATATAGAGALGTGPGSIGAGLTTATGAIPIIRTMGAILTVLTLATRMATTRMITVHIPTARTSATLPTHPIRPARLHTVKTPTRLRRATPWLRTAGGTASAKARSLSRLQVRELLLLSRARRLQRARPTSAMASGITSESAVTRWPRRVVTV